MLVIVASGDICVPAQRLEIMQDEDCVKFQQLSNNKMIILKRNVNCRKQEHAICIINVIKALGLFINRLNAKLNPICYLLALLGAHHFLHVSRIRVKLLTFRLLMSYIYIWSTHS